MGRTYDIFEMVRDSLIWKESVSGHEAALARMQDLARDSQNEFRLMHLSTNAVIAIIQAKEKLSATSKAFPKADHDAA